MGRAASGYEVCTGCNLCLLACPVWRATRDIRLTPHGRARALQCGATAGELAASIDACTFCGACEPACPEDIGLLAMMVGLRAELARHAPERAAQARNRMEHAMNGEARAAVPPAPRAATLLVPDQALHADPALLARMVALLGGSGKVAVAEDDGSDMALALEAGAAISDARLERFLAPLRRAGRLIVGDGMLFRTLREWLPGARMESLGVAASSAVRDKLRASDLYVIEPRAYHADQERLVKYYDALRASLGCSMNLDLQRLAIPTTAGSLTAAPGPVDLGDQARWILEGREFARIVVEDLNDIAAFAAVTDKPVVHLAQLI
jgi:NAD-dependent dihydropyrimidine dehydrogenase PreA subunit